jgi:HAD superfamily hydrolase (TIGR01549 family)
MANGGVDRVQLKAIIFDLDGTLYRQDTVRRTMVARLLRAYAARPLTALRTMRVLHAYRQAQELLRDATASWPATTSLAEAQILLASKRAKVDRDVVAECVARWMEQEPLSLLARAIQPELSQFLGVCKSRGLRLGVLSDYPADAKVDALCLNGIFDVVLSAQSPGVDIFKPHPRGLKLVMKQLQVTAAECLYVGDRAEIDGAVAAAAGVPCVILTSRVQAAERACWTPCAGYAELQQRLFGPRLSLSEAAQPTLDFG